MSELKYKHFFVVKNGKFVFESKEMLSFVKRNLEGKRGYAIIEEVKNDPSPNQYAYYFGGIIRKECMQSNVFAGLSESEIHNILLSELRSHTVAVHKADGGTILKSVPEDFKCWNKTQMANYITEVIAFLQTEFNIHPKPADHYKYNKYHLDVKVIR